jgi:hypothetical protein
LIKYGLEERFRMAYFIKAVATVIDFFNRGCYLGKISITLSLLNNLPMIIYIFLHHSKRHYRCFSNNAAAIFIGVPFPFGVEVIAEKEQYNLLGVGD